MELLVKRNGWHPLRPFGRRLLTWRYRLFQTHRHNRLVLEEVAGRSIVVLPQVFNPKLFRSGEFLVRCLGPELIRPGAAVLDMGTGTGVGAVFAAEWAGSVVAIDINPAAVRCARINALLHHCERKIDVREGNLFDAAVGEKFDVVLFNPPYYEGEPGDALDQAFRSSDVVEQFAAGLDTALNPGGRTLLVVSSDTDLASLLETMRRYGFGATVLFQKELINETVIVYSFERR
ncbi:MAG TPA: HemK2/MTQ2 family protein methyltransferase [Blastocatellia bacterium]|jgi:release factor glutamine methyltransferase|nr:HemK2/MTQ2 family protein methyltransferase [Blastocatellia bacterium]